MRQLLTQLPLRFALLGVLCGAAVLHEASAASAAPRSGRVAIALLGIWLLPLNASFAGKRPRDHWVVKRE